MVINKKTDGTSIVFSVAGRLNTNTAVELETEVKSSIENMTDVTFDLKELEYISSAGLRVLLSVQKIMNKKGKMTIINCNDDIMDIFDVTGFTDILNIE
ncbi:MAG: STAS domain-containing protein [Ruminococcus sp.]|nr:STAS domain-containing protein [Ruminococcus sp.]